MTTAERPRTGLLIGFALAGAAVSLVLGAYGRIHDPSGEEIPNLWFSSTFDLKAWFATAVLALACVQVLLALGIYGKLPLRGSWVGRTHRGVGTAAFLISLPVAYACLWTLGYQTYDDRTAAHSLLGCAFYGVFTTKVLVVRSARMPGWALPLLGSALFTVVVATWWTSALWYFRTSSGY